MLQLIDFIKSNKDWEEKLGQKPYCVSVKRKDNLAIFTYNQIDSDFFNPLVRECRGVVLDLDTVAPVCVPFFKFGNYGEGYASKIDWSSAVVQEKIDGSLIKVWWYDGEWRVSTNGTIDARDAPVANDVSPYENFYELFMIASKNVLDYSILNKNYTYLFELVSPFNKIVVPYGKTKIYHLGTKDNNTLKEIDVDIGVEKPKVYNLRSLSECIEAAKTLPFNDEGYVVVDRYWNRIKIKSPAYVAAHHLRNNGVITKARIVAMLKLNEQDEFLSYYPEYRSMFNKTESLIASFILTMETEIKKVKPLLSDMSRKDFAELAKKTICPTFMFNWLDRKTENPRDWLMAQNDSKIVQLISALDNKEKEG